MSETTKLFCRRTYAEADIALSERILLSQKERARELDPGRTGFNSRLNWGIFTLFFPGRVQKCSFYLLG